MANSAYKGITIKYEADTTGAAKALRDIDKQATGTTADLRKLNNALKLDPGNTELIAEKQAVLARKIQAATEKLETYKKIEAQGKGQEGMTDQLWSQMKADIALTTKELEKYQNQARKFEVSKDLEAAQHAAREAREEVELLGKALDLDPDNIERIADKQDALTKAIKASEKELEEYKKIQSSLKHEDLSEKEWTELKLNIVKCESAIKEYNKELKTMRGEQVKTASEAWHEVKDSVQDTREEIRLLDQAMKLDPSSIELSEKKAEALKRGIAEAKEEVQKLKQVQSQFKDEDLSRKEWAELELEISKAEKAVEEYNEELDKMNGKSVSTVSTAGEKFAAVGDAIETSSRKIAHAGDTYTRTISLGLVGASALAVKKFEDMDSALTSVRKTVDGSAEDYDKLRESAVEFSKTNAVSADQLLEIEALGAQLGFSLDELEKFGEVASGLDIATNMDAEQAATEMAHFANIMAMSHDEIDKYASTIVGLGNTTATTESDISSMAQRIAGAGKSIGLSSADVLGLAAALSSLGIEAEAGGTAISTILSNIDSSVAMATQGIDDYADELGMTTGEFIDALNGDETLMKQWAAQYGISLSDMKKANKEFFDSFAHEHGMKLSDLKKEVNDSTDALHNWAEAAGMSAEQFAAAWKKDPVEAFQAVAKGLQQGVEEGSNLSVMLSQLGIDSIRQTDLMKRIANSGNLMADTIAKANENWSENAALTNEVANKNDSLSAKFEMLKNRVVAIATKVGEPLANAFLKFLDAAEPVFDTIEDLANAFSNMDEQEQKMIVTIGLQIAALGPFLSILGRVGTGLGTLSKGFGTVLSGMKEMKAGMKVGAEGAENLTKVAGSLKAGLAGIALAAAACLIAFSIDQWNKYQTELRKTAEASKSLADMEKDAESAIKDTSDTAGSEGLLGLFAYRDEITKLKDSYKELREQVIKSNEKFSEAYGEQKVASEMAATYAGQIEELTKKQSLNEDEQNQLKTAVELYNQVTGDSLGIIDAQTGTLTKSTEEIKRNTKAWEKNAYVQIYQDRAKSALEERIKAEEALPEAQKALADAERELAEKNEQWAADSSGNWERWATEIGNAEQKVRDAQGVVDSLNGSIKTSNDTIDAATSRISNMETDFANTVGATQNLVDAFRKVGPGVEEAIKGTALDVDSFAELCQEAGLRAENLGGMTEESFKKMAHDCKYNVSDMINVMKEWDAQGQETNRQVGLIRDNIEGRGDEIKKKFEELGVDVNNFAYGLYDAGIKAEDMKYISTKALGDMVQECGGDFEKLKGMLEETRNAIRDNLTGAFVNLGPEAVTAIESMGIPLDDFITKLLDAGVRADHLEGLTIDSFRNMKDECGTNVDDMVARLVDLYNHNVEVNRSIDDIAMNIRNRGPECEEAIHGVDKSTEDMAKQFHEAGIKADDMKDITTDAFLVMWEQCDNDVNKMKKKLDEWNEKKMDPKKAEINQDDLDSAIYKTGTLKKELDQLSRSRFSVNIYENRFSNTGTGQGGSGAWTNAAGGHIPAHADGGSINGILSSATLTNVGWIGEAGAEAAYSDRWGSHIIPLTNDKYADIFAGKIAEHMGGRGDVYVTVDLRDAQLNNDKAIEDKTLDLLEEVARKGEMNRG